MNVQLFSVLFHKTDGKISWEQFLEMTDWEIFFLLS